MQNIAESSIMPSSNLLSESIPKSNRVGILRRFLNAISLVLCLFFGTVLLINVTLIIQSLTNENKVPDVFGMFPLVVMSDSMYPTIQSGDMAIYLKSNTDQVKVGDIVVFYDPADSTRQSLVTHRIVSEVTENGEVLYTTKGDANNVEDSNLVPSSEIVGIYKGSISKAGNIALFMQTTKGMLVCIVIPLCIIVLFDSFGRGKRA